MFFSLDFLVGQWVQVLVLELLSGGCSGTHQASLIFVLVLHLKKKKAIKILVFLQSMGSLKLCCLQAQICFLPCMLSLLLPLESAGSRSSMACPSWFAAACCLQRFVRAVGPLLHSGSSSSMCAVNAVCILKQTHTHKGRNK